jgi:hypothetical protein
MPAVVVIDRFVEAKGKMNGEGGINSPGSSPGVQHNTTEVTGVLCGVSEACTSSGKTKKGARDKIDPVRKGDSRQVRRSHRS